MFNGSTMALYRWLIDNEPYGFQILCGWCNASKNSGDACRLTHIKIEIEIAA